MKFKKAINILLIIRYDLHTVRHSGRTLPTGRSGEEGCTTGWRIVECRQLPCVIHTKCMCSLAMGLPCRAYAVFPLTQSVHSMDPTPCLPRSTQPDITGSQTRNLSSISRSPAWEVAARLRWVVEQIAVFQQDSSSDQIAIATAGFASLSNYIVLQASTGALTQLGGTSHMLLVFKSLPVPILERFTFRFTFRTPKILLRRITSTETSAVFAMASLQFAKIF